MTYDFWGMGRIGLEIELPLVDHRGQAVSNASVIELFRRLADGAGFTVYDASGSGIPLGVYAEDSEGRLDIGTDYGFCTLEVALPPAPNAATAEAAWRKLLDSLLLPTLERQDLFLLGYGCQPKTRATGPAYVANKPHYEVMTRLIDRHPIFPADAWPSFAALQFNLDVPYEDVIPLTNALIMLSPLILAWSANSPVFGGEIQPWIELRAQAYLEMNANPIFTDRFFFPRRPFTSISDYLHRAWSQPIIEVTRDSGIYRPLDESLTTLDFAARPAAEFVDLDGNLAELECQASDLATGLSSIWPAVRLKLSLDTTLPVREIVDLVISGEGEGALVDEGRSTFIEIRHLPTMGHEEGFAWLAMILGWMATTSELAAFADACSLDDARRCFDQVLVNGWNADLTGRPLVSWGADALALARDGLGGQPELSGRLALLEDRLFTRSSPAAQAIEVFRSQGVDSLVEMTKLM